MGNIMVKVQRQEEQMGMKWGWEGPHMSTGQTGEKIHRGQWLKGKL